MKKTPTIPAFFGTAKARTAEGSHLALFAAPHGTPYRGIDNRTHATSGDAFRLAMEADQGWVSHYDWDFGGPIIPGPPFRAVDLGNLKTSPKDAKGNRQKIEEQTKAICDAGAVPLMFGGDDSVPIPFLAGLSAKRGLTILQIDAHIDWRNEREGETMGFSSTMKRASELPHISRIVQAGARGIGSARDGEVEDARQWGARFVTSSTILDQGVAPVLAHIDPGANVVVCLDLDALDSSVMPAVAYPSPGGITFHHVASLLAGVAAKAKIAGFCMVEFVPKKDINGTAAFTAGRIAAHVIGHVARQVGR